MCIQMSQIASKDISNIITKTKHHIISKYNHIVIVRRNMYIHEYSIYVIQFHYYSFIIYRNTSVALSCLSRTGKVPVRLI